jgi:hypothetical protein
MVSLDYTVKRGEFLLTVIWITVSGEPWAVPGEQCTVDSGQKRAVKE